MHYFSVREVSNCWRLCLLVLIFLFLTVGTAIADSDKFREIEQRWIANYGQTHPFSNFERLAITQPITISDMRSLGCKKSGARYLCKDGIVVKNNRIESVESCKPSPFNMRELIRGAGLPSNYAEKMFSSMERTWNQKSTYITYSISNDIICVKGEF